MSQIFRHRCNTRGVIVLAALTMTAILWPVFAAGTVILPGGTASLDLAPLDPVIQNNRTESFSASWTLGDGSTQALDAVVTHISAGLDHTCLVRANGRVQCWGHNASGDLGNYAGDSAVPVFVSGISSATAVSAGSAHTCALLDDGRVSCWGGNYAGALGNADNSGSSVPAEVSGISSAVAIAAGTDTSCALIEDGTVYCWGDNRYGSLGDGTYTSSSSPVQVSDITTATAIVAGGSFNCALLADGAVRCWGVNNGGQLGNGTTSVGVPPYGIGTPVAVSGITSARSIAAGGAHACAVLLSGEVQCWGDNYHGQLGNGGNTSSLIPVTVSGISTAVAVSAGFDHSCALLAGGQVQCWGDNSDGQLGNSILSSSNVPVTVTGVDSALSIEAGGMHSCALLGGAGIRCWGSNSNGQIGVGYPLDRGVPVAAYGIASAVGIAAGKQHSCAIMFGGSVQCWGDNRFQQSGNGTVTSDLPEQVVGTAHVTSISGGDTHTCALLNDGHVECWGFLSLGSLGDGTTRLSATPVMVAGISTATAIASGNAHSCALLSDGTVRCWGWNGDGQLGDGSLTDADTPVTVSGITTAVAIAAGGYHSCAALADGAVKCWGRNAEGQLGSGAFDVAAPYSETPVTVAGLTGVIALGAGVDHTCALLGDGTIQCWGSNSAGQLGVSGLDRADLPVAVGGVTAARSISSGSYHNCAKLGDGRVQCWGDNSAGQLGDGSLTGSSVPVFVSGVSSALAVAAGGWHSCALFGLGVVQCWGGNHYGQLGDGSVKLNYTAPAAVIDSIGVSWSSSDPAVASIDADGKATSHQYGSVTITATLGGLIGSTSLSVKAALAMNSVGSGVGTVTGAGFYDYGQSAAVSAVADAGSSFTGWSGADATECASGSVLMTGDKSCTATFTLNSYSLSITAAGTGFGSVSGGGTYSYGEVVSVSAVTDPGSTFTGWSGSDAAECGSGSVLISGDKRCTATFTLNSYSLTTATDGTGSGSVKGGGSYAYGDLASVSAVTDPGSTFTGWGGADATECASGSVLMTGDKSCTATFTLNVYSLSINAAGTGSGSVSGGGPHAYGEVVSVSAVADPGSTFTGWSGSNAAECATGTVTMSGGKTCVAVFDLTPPPVVTADLKITDITVSAADAQPGQSVSITATVRNAGSVAVGGFVIDLYKNAAGPPGKAQAGDMSCTVNGLAAGAETVCARTTSYDVSGPYQVWASVDAANAVAESDEGNNIAGPVAVSIGSADSAVTSTDAARSGGGSFDPLLLAIMVSLGGLWRDPRRKRHG